MTPQLYHVLPQMDRRDMYPEQDQTYQQRHSDEEEEDEEGYERGRRKGASVDEFLQGSELGRPVSELGQ